MSWRRTWQPTPVFLPGEFHWTEELGGLQSIGSQRVKHDRSNFTHSMKVIPSDLAYGTSMQSESESRSVVSDSLQPHGLYTTWSSPGHNTGVGSLFLLQGIFSTQGLNAGLLHCRQILYQLSHKGSPRILEWIAYPFSSRSYWARNRTEVSCIAGRFITNWAIREAMKWQFGVIFHHSS